MKREKNMKPILFNTQMVRAIQEGRKTQTRRVIKPTAKGALPLPSVAEYTGIIAGRYTFETDTDIWSIPAPHQVGDTLYVRETWTHTCYGCNVKGVASCSKCGTCPEYLYKADYDNSQFEETSEEVYSDFAYCIKWKPSIHMPKEAARIFLQVTSVHPERLQDITAEGAIAEGIQSYWTGPHRNDAPFIGAAKGIGEDLCFSPIEAYSQVWNSTVKSKDLDQNGWDANNWVWAYELMRIEKPEEEMK